MQHFSGAHVTKQNINLGGVTRSSALGGSTPQALIERARRDRQERDTLRRHNAAAARIQAFYRGRRAASASRSAHRAQFDQLLKSSAQGLTLEQSLVLTRLLSFSLVQGNPGDLKRAASWARLILAPAGASTANAPALFAHLLAPSAPAYLVLIRYLIHALLAQAIARPSIAQAPLFLEIAKLLIDPASYAKWGVGPVKGKGVLEYLLERGLHAGLRRLLLAIPPNQKTHPAIPATIALSLLPFKAYPAATPTATTKAALPPPSAERTTILTSFTLQILTVPLLPNRVPLSALTALAGLPLEDILLQLAAPATAPALAALSIEDSANLLANLLAFSGKKVASFASGKTLTAYLGVLNGLLNRIPASALEPKKAEEDDVLPAVDAKGKGKEILDLTASDDDSDDEEIVQRAKARLTQDGDGDTSMGGAPPPKVTPPTKSVALDPRTLSWLNRLHSREDLVAILGLSTRFSASTRPALAAFLVSLIASFPSRRDSVLSTIMYGGPSTSAAAERGGGLLRELYRGYVRSSAVGRLLGAGEKFRTAAVLAGLEDEKLGGDWPALILLTELYSRCLLTLGDDEFHGPRNPLSLDEVVGLSGQLRNLAFTLYWCEDSLGTVEVPKIIAGTRVSYESLRAMSTSLLQAIYARDSRRAFAPEGHWLMTSQFDLASFIQTVIYEDQQLDTGVEDVGGDPQPQRSIWDDGEEEPSRPRSKHNLTKRQMSFISPRLGVLNNIPFVLPFENRVQIFRQFVENDRARLGIQRDRFTRGKRHRAVVRRDHLSEDAYSQLNGLGAALKGSIEIVFKDAHGFEESGIDGGGLFKELLTSLSKEAFNPDRGIWLETSQNELYPSSSSYARESDNLAWFAFLGRILGKALYEGILVSVRFADFFLAKWLGRQSYLDDLASLDPELYKGLLYLKNYEGNVEDLSLNFTITEDEFGVKREVALVPGGADVAVTNENRTQYILLTAHYKLNASSAKQCEAFFSGLSDIIPERFLRLFNQQELRVLVGGADQPIDVRDLKENTFYGGWDEAHETVRAFWRVVESLDKEDLSALVKFVTSVPRPPLLGFGELTPRFAIRHAGSEQDRLPTASTCVNLMKLPAYESEDLLRRKLLQAIRSNAGFDLS